MRTEPVFITGAAIVAAAFTLTAITLLTTDPVFAAEAEGPRSGFVCCGDRPAGAPASRPEDSDDRTVALEALQVALTNVPDGATFTWRRWNGRLRGAIKPAFSFKAADGTICRHIIVSLATETRKNHIEGIACRLEDGSWQIDG